MTRVDKAKKLVSEERHRIKLHELVAEEVRELLPLISEESIPIQRKFSAEEFAELLIKYEEATRDFCRIGILVAYWGTSSNHGTLTMAVQRLVDGLVTESNSNLWTHWYPVLLFLYSCGIAAVAAAKFDNLKAIMHTGVEDTGRPGRRIILIRAITKELKNAHDAFKKLPGHENQHVPRSEYIFNVLRPTIDSVLYLGSEYEIHFDRFEVLFAMEHAEIYAREAYGRVWGPVGRFGWKYDGEHDLSPLHKIVLEADMLGESWPPLNAGLFNGSTERFKEIASEFSRCVAELSWH